MMEKEEAFDHARLYEIHIQGHLDSRWEVYFPGMEMDLLPKGITRLRGVVSDPAALHGILNRIRNLGLPLLLVESKEVGKTGKINQSKEYQMERKLDLKRIWIFIGLSFGLAWAVDLVVYLSGGLDDLKAGSISYLLLLVSMAAPALANILTRFITREGWKQTYLKPHLKANWGKWLLAWFLVPCLVLTGTTLFYLLWPQFFDSSLAAVQQLLDQLASTAGKEVPLSSGAFLGVQILETILLAPILGSMATFGEEFGWRAYLLPKLTPLGQRKALLLSGLIWGLWHWPIIAMGYNYGMDYPGAPWLGLLGMVWFTMVVGVLFGWMVLQSGSVWPAVIGHAALNGWGQLNTLLVTGQPNTLLGPNVTGLVASLPLVLVSVYLFLKTGKGAGKQEIEPAQQ